ncbi:MAG: hypothetical protein MI862_09700 [Desulfobacterales bacterium]|nr:hypothetical protein [Desulfobacterales bacterium]
MQYPGKDQKKLRGIFPATSRDSNKNKGEPGSPAVFSSTEQFYAVVSGGQVTDCFKLILRSGKKHSIPYALLPICTLDGDTLYIKAYECFITISGRNLDPIEEYFSNRLLLWVKASPSGKDDGQASTFVKDIIAQGDAIPASEDN